MTNKEILQSDILDILFEHRNKAYGAYALRRTYDRRLLTALITAMSVILLFIFFDAFGNNTVTINQPGEKNNTVVLNTYEIPKDETEKPKEPEKPRQVAKPVEPVATIRHNTIVVKPDKDVPVTEMAENADLKGKAIGNNNSDGKEPGDIVQPETPGTGTGNATPAETGKQQDEFVPYERQPEFPGGMEALRRFLSRHLDTPGELNSGEKKTVMIRFWVGRDGSISALEIEQSGGDIFDKEVIRVCKKMPRWSAAVQNGTTVPVSYLLPVTFIGPEQ